jgi:nucleoside-diphosphate-sugar epimerase
MAETTNSKTDRASIIGNGKVFITGGSGFVGRNLLRRLVADNNEVRAIARSDSAARIIADLGAEVVTGDLSDVQVLAQSMAGIGVVIHVAAQVSGTSYDDMHTVNVEGTRNVVQAASAAGVSTVVHVSTEQVLLGGTPIINADESWPYPARPLGPYAQTKGQAERIAISAATSTLRVVAVRPRFVWGVGDTTVLPAILSAIENGSFRWIDHGNYLTSTCHVRNLVEGILAAVRAGETGQSYFITDGAPVTFREIVTAMAETRGVDIPERSLPLPVARCAAAVTEFVWRATRRPGVPPLDRATVAVIGQTCTVSDAAARASIGYVPVITVESGLREMTETAAAALAKGLDDL